MTKVNSKSIKTAEQKNATVKAKVENKKVDAKAVETKKEIKNNNKDNNKSTLLKEIALTDKVIERGEEIKKAKADAEEKRVKALKNAIMVSESVVDINTGKTVSYKEYNEETQQKAEAEYKEAREKLEGLRNEEIEAVAKEDVQATAKEAQAKLDEIRQKELEAMEKDELIKYTQQLEAKKAKLNFNRGPKKIGILTDLFATSGGLWLKKVASFLNQKPHTTRARLTEHQEDTDCLVASLEIRKLNPNYGLKLDDKSINTVHKSIVDITKFQLIYEKGLEHYINISIDRDTYEKDLANGTLRTSESQLNNFDEINTIIENDFKGIYTQ